MDESGPELSFLGLPLTAEQESEVRHYLHKRMRRGLPCENQELRSMLADMLAPPMLEKDADFAGAENVHAFSERAASLVDDSPDGVSAREEWIAAWEAEAMKHPGE